MICHGDDRHREAIFTGTREQASFIRLETPPPCYPADQGVGQPEGGEPSIDRHLRSAAAPIPHAPVSLPPPASSASLPLFTCFGAYPSSMFVSRRRWILKTCGTTTPLRCVRAVLALARDTAGHARVHNVFYSRREFARPHAQLTPHDNFDSEVELLDSFFCDGRAYIMGPEKDCWYLYTLLPLEGTVAALEKEHREASEVSAGCAGCEPDQTIEILMSDLDPAVMNIFTRAHSASAHHATKESGIDKIIPGMVIDDYLFDPCGYSMNGVAKDGCYMTIHITPERSCSYVSFESNVPVSSYDEVVARVLHAFRPGRFVLTVFATPDAAGSAAPRQLKSFSSLCGYEQKEAQYCRFSGYELHYALYAKFPS
ncbi:S-adenosylmethionine decarboxylase proenzyme [Papilio machaon]|uniref:S-adenosylmethionine decarboxylase proenzyme n=2 Tax=Papilio machaon TaxID=76193 RepID=A0A194R5A8_PAPMA|nr:S-adenosylmethionine decarboxylase proenzyme [Papilio machaon]